MFLQTNKPQAGSGTGDRDTLKQYMAKKLQNILNHSDKSLQYVKVGEKTAEISSTDRLKKSDCNFSLAVDWPKEKMRLQESN